MCIDHTQIRMNKGTSFSLYNIVPYELKTFSLLKYDTVKYNELEKTDNANKKAGGGGVCIIN